MSSDHRSAFALSRACEPRAFSRRDLLVGGLAGAALLAGGAPAAVWAQVVRPNRPADASDPFFKDGQIPRIKLEIGMPEMQKLRQEPRKYVKAKLVENDQAVFADVGVKLKGAAGSFRGVDDRPALTVNFDKFIRDQSFHSLDKIHLNNSVQDATYLHELISAEVCAAANVPAARATHARVWLNGRDLGFYVLKEGLDTTFLKRHFADAKGNLYDGGFCREIDSGLEKDSGRGPDDHSDLKALVAACREGDPKLRWQKVGELLDVEAYLTFMAVELMTCHWDGYCNNRNNYRVYFDPKTKKAYFFPHGMDQMFGDTNASVLNTPGALISSTVLQNPDWRARYRDRLQELLPIISPPDKLLARIDQAHGRIRPVLAAIHENAARDHDGQVRGLKDRIVARGKNLEMQNAQQEPRPLKFNDKGIAALPKWYAKTETSDARQEETTVDGVKAYLIAAGPNGRCIASWRTKVMLPTGRYELQGRVKTADVSVIADGSGAGAGLRVSGGQRSNKLHDTSPWQLLKHELQVGAPLQEFELVAELRATKGQAWFDAGSLQIVRQ